MKAIVYTQYGPPDVLRLEEVGKPSPNDDEVLIKIRAAAANPLDWHFMRASPVFVRFFTGLLKPKVTILGADIAGQVEAVGANVTRFQVGDAVYGDISRRGFAEYACAVEDKLALKPANISFEEAAAVPVAGLTALQCLRDQGQIESGQKVLINGASGGVGTFAVQIAKSFGAEVTGVCSTRNVDVVRTIGADEVIDYTRQDFSQNGVRYDLILDNVGNRSASAYKRVLSPTGTYLLNAFSPRLTIQLMFQGRGNSKAGGQKMVSTELARSDANDLKFLAELLDAGELVSVIDRRYTLGEVPEAIRYIEEGHARGKVVFNI